MKLHVIKLLTLVFTVCALSSHAQITPQPSSTQTITQDFGMGKINLTYSRPNVKGRKIFGQTEPYGKVWRTGANSATSIRFSDDVSLDGHAVPAGTYGLFTVPGENEWTVIISKKPNQWGAYSYSDKDDLLRFTVKPEKTTTTTETFTIVFSDVYPTHAEMHLMWEHTALTIHLKTDIDAKVMARIDSAMKTDKKPYYEAIIYYWNNNKDLKPALAWATELEKNPDFPPFVPKLWKARVQLKTGDKAGAIVTATAGAEAAKKANNDEYVRLNNEVIAEAKK